MRRCPKCTDVAGYLCGVTGRMLPGYLCGVTGPLLPEGDSMQFIYHFDIAALAIGFIIMADYASKNTIKSRQTRAFLHILHMAVLASAFDLGSTFALHYASVLPLWFNDFLLIGFNITFHALTPLYLYYVIMCVKKPDEKLSEKELVYILGLYAADMAMLFTNKFTKFVYYIDENYEYHSGMGAKVSYAIAGIYLLIILIYLIKNRAVLSHKQITIVTAYSVLIVGGLAIQILVPSVLLVNFCVMLAVLILSFTIESPSYYEEPSLGIYNRIAFQTVCEEKIASGKQFSVIGLSMESLTDYRDIVGINSVSQMLKEASDFIEKLVGRKNVFSVSEFRFAIIVEGGESEVEMHIKKLKRRFDEPFKANEEGIRVSYSMSKFAFPRDVQTTENVLNLLDCSLGVANDQGRDTVLQASSELLNEKNRAGHILQIIRRSLAEGRFSVYYQPIYSVEKQCFSSAEALIRLYDDEYGFISPSEFVPIAEKNGLMVKVGDFVFDAVCRFMVENDTYEKGIEYIAVNISAVQCLQDDLHERLITIMDRYKLDYKRICLEITETAGLLKGKVLRNNMKSLIESGVRFSLDNYGSGFANLTTVVEYPFSVVKLDKNMLWNAMKNDKAMTVLRQTIRMMKQLSLELVAEGVETEEQSQLLAYYGCDFFQGYYYAKPQNAESFLKLVEKRNK